VEQPFNTQFVYEYTRPRKGRWAHEVEAWAARGQITDASALSYSVEYTATYFVNDAFSVYLGGYVDRSQAWSVWQRDNLVGVYRGREWHANAGLTWNLANRQELRIKLQALAIDARARSAYRVLASTMAAPTEEPVDDFSVINLGFQVRYRYEVAPMSDLYVVYARGGYQERDSTDGIGSLLSDSARLRDDEQLLVKFSYRFEL
jgi:hypothetical protein